MQNQKAGFGMLLKEPLQAWNNNNSAPTGRILMQSDIWVFSKICQENSTFNKIWPE